MVHRRELEGETLVFGNQGDLYGNAMTWWDHRTGSVWSQPRGEAILGPLAGARLELLPSTLTTWGDWLDAHPDSLALDAPAGFSGFALDQMAIAVDLGEVAAYRVTELRSSGVVNDVVAGVEIAVVADPGGSDRWAVFSRRLDATTVELTMTDEGLVDRATGSVFDPFVGIARSGPLRGQVLDKLPAFTVFPKDFPTFYPDGRLWPDEA